MTNKNQTFDVTVCVGATIDVYSTFTAQVPELIRDDPEAVRRYVFAAAKKNVNDGALTYEPAWDLREERVVRAMPSDDESVTLFENADLTGTAQEAFGPVAASPSRRAYMVVGCYDDGQRYATMVFADSGEDAETVAREEYVKNHGKRAELPNFCGTVRINNEGSMEMGS